MSAIEEIRSDLISSLSAMYGAPEAKSLAGIALEFVTGYTQVEQSLHRKDNITDDQKIKLHLIKQRLLEWEPIQYIIGETEFLGLKFKVNPSVLIPRPETEELVLLADKYIKESPKKKPGIIDIGTGSGCIAVLLKHLNPEIDVTAVDISKDALNVAKLNAARNQTEIDFREYDILNFQSEMPFSEAFDIIVSNPPYVTQSDKKLMRRNVLDFEPETALYVTDEDPLLFYRRIAEFARINLASGGVILLEINESYAEELICLMQPDFRVKISADLSNRQRFAFAKKIRR